MSFKTLIKSSLPEFSFFGGWGENNWFFWSFFNLQIWLLSLVCWSIPLARVHLHRISSDSLTTSSFLEQNMGKSNSLNFCLNINDILGQKLFKEKDVTYYLKFYIFIKKWYFHRQWIKLNISTTIPPRTLKYLLSHPNIFDRTHVSLHKKLIYTKSMSGLFIILSSQHKEDSMKSRHSRDDEKNCLLLFISKKNNWTIYIDILHTQGRRSITYTYNG